MVKYRLRPIVIEAYQWFPGCIALGVRDDPKEGPPYVTTYPTGERQYIEPGDWIIQTPIGDNRIAFSVMPDSQFWESYMQVPDDANLNPTGEADDPLVAALLTQARAENPVADPIAVQGYEMPRISILISVAALPNPVVTDLLTTFGPIIGIYGGTINVLIETPES